MAVTKRSMESSPVMSNEHASQDDNVEREASGPSLGPSSALRQPQELQSGMVWQWPSLILVQRTPSAGDPHAQHETVLLAPTRSGFEFIENLDAGEVQSVWIVRWTQEGQLIAESVKHVRNWGLGFLKDREELIVLLCASGAVFVVDEYGLFEVDEVIRQWTAGGNYKPNGKFLEVFTVERGRGRTATGVSGGEGPHSRWSRIRKALCALSGDRLTC